MALLCGRPVLFYTLKVALEAAVVDRVIVSSECDNVLDYAQKQGAEIRRRPGHLSDQHVRNEHVIQDVLAQESECGREPEFVVLLQPTHPLRDPRDIEHGVQLMRERPEADCLFTVVPAEAQLGEIDQSGRFVPEFPLPRSRQLEPTRFRNTGSFYIFRTQTTFARGAMFGDTILPFQLEHPEFEVDIDHHADLVIAEALLKANREHFSNFPAGAAS